MHRLHSLPRKNSSRILHDTKTDCAERSMLGDIISSFAVLDGLYAWGKYQIDPAAGSNSHRGGCHSVYVRL